MDFASEVRRLPVYQRIRSYLHDHGIKQKWLASKIGMKGSVMSMKMNGRVDFSIDEVQRICGVLKIPAESVVVPYDPMDTDAADGPA